MASVEDKLVVVKKLRRQKHKNERDRFAKEVRILNRLRCKNIVGVEGYRCYPVAVLLEYVCFDFTPLGISNGACVSSLTDFLEYLNQSDSVEQMPFLQMKIANDVVTAVEFIHKDGIVHRDIKPPNVLVSNQHYCHLQSMQAIENTWSHEPVVCKLADFGESRSNLHQTATINHTNTTNL